MARKPSTQEALSRLADRMEFGHLLADTQPVTFLDNVSAELDYLRARLTKLETVMVAADEVVRIGDNLISDSCEPYWTASEAYDAAKAELEKA